MVKKKAKRPAPRGKPSVNAEPSPFERLSNKKRFDILGKKVKGEVKHVGRLRTAATEKRKETLLVEYKQLRKSNAFIDRRFGEDDEALTADERALLRFQKQRLRDLAGSKFTLSDAGDDGPGGQEEPLTHLGRSLAELEDGGPGWGSDDEDDAGLDDQLTRDLHFGGGFVPSQRGSRGGDDDAAPAVHKSKKEVMEEIIAKSKMHKALKAQQKEEDDKEIDALDAQWKDLVGGTALLGMLRPKGAKLGAQAVDDSDKRFDVLTKELVFEAKAQPGERTLTAEELAEFERRRLEELEKQRVKRQRGGGDDDEDDFEIDGAGPGATDALPAGGFAARRAKRARAEAERAKLDSDSDGDSEGGSDSEDGDSEDGSSDGEGEEEEDGLTALERRRRAQAAGSHPLQESFRELAAKLMSKHGIAPDAEGGSEGEEGTESGSDEDDDEGDSEGGESSSGEEADGSEDSDSEREPEAAPAEADVVGKGAAVAGGTLTFTPPLPETYQAFSAMVEGLSADDLGEMVARIRAFNAAALATEGRKRMQVFYGCLMQHFVTLAAATPPEMAHLDALVPHIFALTSHVPFYAATLARTRLTKAHKQLAQRLRDPVLKAQAWPAPRVLLLLRLFTVLYPVSDKRHPVLTPASLLATSALTLCPLARPRDVATGLFLASLVVHMHAEAKRFAPEPLNFAVELLHSAVPGRLTEDGDPAPQWLSLGAEQQKGLAKTVASIEPLSIDGVLGADDSDAYFSSAEFKSAAAVAAIRLVGRMAEVLSDIDALPEVMAPAQEALKAVASMAHAPQANGKTPKSKKSPANTSQTVAPAVAALAVEVLSQVDAAVEAARSRRRPLFNRALVAVPEKKQYNPRYEDGFATGKDYDPDRERAERKRLQRELRREERGAARELRKDAAFMAGVRDKEKAQAQGELDASARRAMAFLQKQESDFKSGGQGGMWKKKKKK